jgi:transposase
MSAYSLDLREKIVESVKKGVSKSETARRFGVDRATVKRYCKQPDERGTLEPRKAPGDEEGGAANPAVAAGPHAAVVRRARAVLSM